MEKISLAMAALPIVAVAGFGPALALLAGEAGKRCHAALFVIASAAAWFAICSRGFEVVALLNS